MNRYSRSHLSDGQVFQGFLAADQHDRTQLAELLADLGEVDDRKLYVPQGYPSMHRYCVDARHWSDDVAYKRIRAARTARRFPAIFEGLADGRLHLTGVAMLAKHLAEENWRELLNAATHKTMDQVAELLAARFPIPDLQTHVRPLAPAESASFLPAARPVPPSNPEETSEIPGAPVVGPATVSVQTLPPRPKVTPLAPERFAWQVTVGQSAQQKLRYARELLSHQVPSGDLAQVLEHALDALISRLEKRKFGATDKPRHGKRSKNPRHVPAAIRRQVWRRDKGRCTFVSPNGQRCESRELLEYDHAEPVARGGSGSLSNVRLLCRAHNHYAAEQSFGAGFMSRQRESARSGIDSSHPFGCQ